MTISSNAMDLLTSVVQQLGLEVTDVHDDLVLVSDNPFILKWNLPANRADLYFNEDVEQEKAETLMAILEMVAERLGLAIEYRGAFCLARKMDGTVVLEFFDLMEDNT